MNHALNPDQAALVSAVRDFAQAELVERDRAWDRSEASCYAELGPLYEMGLMGLRVPEAYGGLDCAMLPYAHILRELAAASASVAVTVSVHNMVAEILRNFARPAVRESILPWMTQQGSLAGFAISEPNAGSDPRSAKTRAEKAPGGWKLCGAKMWVTNGLAGRWFVVLARTGPEEGSRGLSMILVDAQQEGVTRTPIHGKMGIRGSETAEMSLDGAFAPEENLLGELGGGLRVAFGGLDGGRIGIASQAQGIGMAALDLMTRYARQREQFGERIANFQAIQWMIADSHTELAAAQALIDRAAWLKDHGRGSSQASSMAKLYASETANRVAYRAVQAHGGYGYVNEFRVEQLYRDARITTIYEGTSEIQRTVISRELLRSA